MLLSEFIKDYGVKKYFRTAKNIKYSLLVNFIQLVLEGEWLGKEVIPQDFSQNANILEYFRILDPETEPEADALRFGDIYIILSPDRYRYGIFLNDKAVLEQPSHLNPQHQVLKDDIQNHIEWTKSKGYEVVLLRPLNEKNIFPSDDLRFIKQDKPFTQVALDMITNTYIIRAPGNHATYSNPLWGQDPTNKQIEQLAKQEIYRPLWAHVLNKDNDSTAYYTGTYDGEHFTTWTIPFSAIEDDSYTFALLRRSTSNYITDDVKWFDTIPEYPLMYNVKDFGAIGDGTTDDIIAIKAALARAESSSIIKTVFMPTGTYKITDCIVIPSGITFFGEGYTTVIVPSYTPTPPNNVISNDWDTGSTNITLKDFRIRRDVGYAQHGILLNGVENLLIENVKIDGKAYIDSGAIAVSSILDNTTAVLPSKNVRIVNCTIENSGNFGVQVGTVDGCSIADNTFNNCYREVIGAEPESGETLRNVAITGNTIIGSIDDQGSETGVIVVTESSGGFLYNVTVTGNIVDGGETAGVTGNTLAGIIVLGGTGVVVSSNSFIRCFGAGIRVGNLTYAQTSITIIGNSIVDCNKSASTDYLGAGITLRNTQTALVTGNNIHGAGHTSSIAESGGAGSNMITGNRFMDVPTTVTPAASSRYWGNMDSTGLGGLNNVDNTSDLNKPISYAQAAVNATMQFRQAIAATQTADFAADPNTFYPVDATAGPVVVTFNPSTSGGQQISVKKVDTSTNSVTVNGLVMVTTNEIKSYISAPAGAWTLHSGNFSITSLDNRYLGSTADATTSAKGRVQLAGDLGGTAALPTTPTAVHITGTESIAGVKTFSSSPIIPTASAADNSTKAASTAYADASALAAVVADAIHLLKTGGTLSGTVNTQSLLPSTGNSYALGGNGSGGGNSFASALIKKLYFSSTALIDGSTAGELQITGLLMPVQAATVSAPTYVKGAMYFDTTLNKLRIGGATAWETVTST